MAQFRLGVCYLEGFGVQQSHAEAARWIESAVAHGLPKAYFFLAMLKTKAELAPPDLFESARLCDIACPAPRSKPRSCACRPATEARPTKMAEAPSRQTQADHDHRFQPVQRRPAARFLLGACPRGRRAS
ncbi:hypothetical protein M885DRAFT_545635 [Pelagophyceae sp. CCMP2097]|nr:hypothetical protein M885DRAFT_545635 [Pelagophyceae sp. CCMP2097]|mmetsp:Transcript_3980/g.13906  ORF Transcript_3980/g.13906 Transcript_3980/m.13906 type:complete len:130 (-) Transcript_3980:456-845(-)